MNVVGVKENGMALPQAVQQQAEEADRLMAQMNGEVSGDNPPTDPAPDTEAPQQELSNEAEPKGNTDIPTEEPPASTVSEDTWEKKYHVLQGKFDAEVPRLYADMREMQAQLRQIEAEKAVAEAKAAEQATTAPAKNLDFEQDKEEFGSDLFNFVDRVAESKVATLKAREAELLQKISKLESKIGDVTERQGVSDNDRFLMGLGQQVSDWEQLNIDPGFLSWLAEVDPIYGLPRQSALTRAVENFNVAQAANIFNAYKTLVTPQTNKPKPSQQLQSQVAPTRSRVSNTPAASDANTKIWREAEIGQFYDAARRGFIDNEEMVRIQKEIDTAISEGRVSL